MKWKHVVSVVNVKLKMDANTVQSVSVDTLHMAHRMKGIEVMG